MSNPIAPTALGAWPGLGLWLCPLHRTPAPDQQAWLDAGEVERAQRFVQEIHRRRHLAAHVALRGRLGAWLGMAPSALRFGADAHGKPRLEGHAEVQFNLSHSDDWALLGAHLGAPVGVDIEALRPVDEALALARKHYTPREREAVVAAPDERARDLAFLRVWTRKEACLKAVGLGLRLAPSSFEAGAQADAIVTRLATPTGLVTIEVRSIDTDIDAVAAVARVIG